jgi:hypothetical protein
MRIESAIKLQNARQRDKNDMMGRPKNYNCINKAKLGRLIWPDQKGQRPLTSMSNLVNGNTKTIRVTWVYIICRETGVDTNFLFRKPSVHDEDYERLCGEKS